MDSVCSLFLADRVRRKVFSSIRASSLIEIGVGSGKNMALLSAPVRAGVDTSLEMLKFARGRFRGLHVFAGDAVRLPLKDGGFEVSVLCYVLRGLSRPVEAVREALRVSTRVVIIDYDRPCFIPRFIWDTVISGFGRAVYGSRDLDFAALEKLGASKEVLKYYGGLYRVMILSAR